MSKGLRNTLIVTGVVLVLGIGGCLNGSDDSPDSGPAPNATSSATPVPTPTSTPNLTKDTVPLENPTSEVMQVSEADLAMASEALSFASGNIGPITAIEGRYIVAEGYKYVDTLTMFKLDSGEKVYFATGGKQPFGNPGAHLLIAAIQDSRDITGFGEEVPVDGPAGIQAAHMYSDHAEKLE